jgi:hypothetical protein
MYGSSKAQTPVKAHHLTHYQRPFCFVLIGLNIESKDVKLELDTSESTARPDTAVDRVTRVLLLV